MFYCFIGIMEKIQLSPFSSTINAVPTSTLPVGDVKANIVTLKTLLLLSYMKNPVNRFLLHPMFCVI